MYPVQIVLVPLPHNPPAPPAYRRRADEHVAADGHANLVEGRRGFVVQEHEVVLDMMMIPGVVFQSIVRGSMM